MTPLRARVLLLLPLLGLCALYVAVKELEPFGTWGRHAFVDGMWGLFSLAATASCFWTARRVEQPNVRLAWRLFGVGCGVWCLGIVEWTRLELLEGELAPFPSLADVGFLAMPLCFIGGMACFRRERRTRSLSLLQASNVGLVLTGALLVITLALSRAVRTGGGSTLVDVVVAANVALFTADFLFGLYCLLLARGAAGPRRILLAIVLGQGFNLLVVVAYLREVLDASYRVGGWLDVAFCLLFALVMLAAQEQRLQAATPAVDPPLEQPRLSALDSYFPMLAMGLCLLGGLPFLDGWTAAPAWLIALEWFLFAACLGLHGLASRQVLADLEGSLRDAERRARELQGLEQLGTLAGGLAHDFNNILTVVGGHTELLRLDPGCAESLQALGDAVDQGRRLTRSLLGLAQRDGHQRDEADVRRLVSAVRRLVAAALPAEVEVKVDVDPTIPPILVATSQLQHALLNLALNARDAMPAGGELTFGARVCGDEPEARLELWVSDTGHGIPPELADRVFEPFFSTKPGDKGQGLGLAMVAQAAKDHGGEVRVESTPGQGTTFTLSLPVVRPQPEAPADAVPVAPGEAVLVVDDDPAVRRLLVDVLSSHGWRVVQAHGVDDALRRIEAEPGLRAVVSDVDMPGRSGLELLEQLGRDRPDLPVVLMSGVLEVDDPRVRAAHALFRKPLDLQRLANAVAELPAQLER